MPGHWPSQVAVSHPHLLCCCAQCVVVTPLTSAVSRVCRQGPGEAWPAEPGCAAGKPGLAASAGRTGLPGLGPGRPGRAREAQVTSPTACGAGAGLESSGDNSLGSRGYRNGLVTVPLENHLSSCFVYEPSCITFVVILLVASLVVMSKLCLGWTCLCENFLLCSFSNLMSHLLVFIKLFSMHDIH